MYQPAMLPSNCPSSSAYGALLKLLTAAQTLLSHCSGIHDKNHVPQAHRKMLNAKPDNVRKESQIVAQAGLPKAVTIATNMAGRGTDIVLGGNPRGLALRVLLKFFAKRLLTGEHGRSHLLGSVCLLKPWLDMPLMLHCHA